MLDYAHLEVLQSRTPSPERAPGTPPRSSSGTAKHTPPNEKSSLGAPSVLEQLIAAVVFPLDLEALVVPIPR